MKLNERMLISLASDPSSPVDKSGFLMKKGEVNTSFQKRYFVLRGNMLFYFEKKQDKEPVGVIILENCHVELYGSEALMFAFQIVFDGSGARRYVLAAETNDEMENWMRKITHAGHYYIKTVVEQLEEKLESLKKAESQMSPERSEPTEGGECSLELVSSLPESNITQETTVAVPKSFEKKKYQTLPPRRPERKKQSSFEDQGFSRWSFSSLPSGLAFNSQRPGPSSEFQDLIDFSERTDFLRNDSLHSSRHFSINDFTPPSYSELKKHEEIEEQTLFDLECEPQGSKLPHGRLAFSNTLANRIKGNRRAKSERHRKLGPISPPKNDLGGSLYDGGKVLRNDSSIIDECNDSKFRYLHRLWGAAIWVKVHEYELENSKEMDSKL